MSAVVTDIRPVPARRSQFSTTIEDTRTVTWRNLQSMRRVPEIIVFSTIQPIIFVLMFRYVFGGAISVPGIPYVDYLMPGIFVQVIAFGSINTAVGLSEDLHSGLIERFRSLPMAGSAMLAGRTTADLIRHSAVILLMVVMGFLVGFRIHTDALAFVAALGILLLFAFSFAWIFATVGLFAPNAEAAQASAFPILATLVFASSAFVPTATMPGWLQVFANHQPVTATANAVRALCLGGPTATDVFEAVAWAVAITAVFAPLAIRRYQRVT
jgi:ABC transporter DrrB family efflux protein